jgi:hypothetical protein
MLVNLVIQTVQTFADILAVDVAQTAFENQFPRLIMPPSESSSESPPTEHDVISDAVVSSAYHSQLCVSKWLPR